MNDLKMNDLKKTLEAGLFIHFDNDKWCEETQSDDLRGGRIERIECFRRMEFLIWFNGTLIHSSKTWKSCENKMNKLFDKWNCIITSIDNEI